MKVEILIGNIASGKTSFCRMRAKEGALIVNDDAIVNMLHAGDYTLYDSALKPIYKAIENQAVMSALSMKRDIVIDRGLNLTRKNRRRWIGLAHSMDCECHAVCFKFDDPSVHASRRQKHDLRGHNYEYWLDVAKCFNDKYEPPSDKEDFDRIITYEHH